MESISDKQNREIIFWRDDFHHSPNSDSIPNVLNKMFDAAIFHQCISQYHSYIPSEGRILELGAGQGWASCLLKKAYPNAHVTTTDISKYAIDSLSKWEKIWNVNINSSYASLSYELNEKNESLDFIFCFASAHHFLAHRKTFTELYRILKPEGRIIYFYEPSCTKLWYKRALKRVNSKRSIVPEDILITKELLTLAQKVGFCANVDYYPSYARRGFSETLYYYILSRLPFLQSKLPCTANFIFKKTSNLSLERDREKPCHF